MNRSVGYAQLAAASLLFLLAFSIMFPFVRDAIWVFATSDLVLPLAGGCAGVCIAWKLVFSGLKHLEPTARDLLARDRRPPVVLLRTPAHPSAVAADPVLAALANDAAATPARSAINRYLNGIGPVIAPVLPGEQLGAAHAAPVFIPDCAWHQEVGAWVRQSRVTLFIPTPATTGSTWELNFALRTLDPTRLMLYFPPESGPANPRENRYSELRMRLTELFPKGLPWYLGNSILIRFDQDWTPHPTRLSELDRFLDPEYKPVSLWQRPARIRTATLALVLAGAAAELVFGFQWLTVHGA